MWRSGFLKLRRFWTHYGRRIFFAAVTTVLVFAAVENLVRWAGWDKLPAEQLFTDVYDPAYEMKPVGLYDRGEVREYLNQNGFRGADLPAARTPGVCHIICAGDSTTFGSNVQANETYAFLLERILFERGVKTEILNAGMPGTWIWPQIMLIRRKLLPLYKPDLIVLYTGPSFRADHLVLENARRGYLMEPVRRGLTKLAVYRLIRRLIRPPRFEDTINQYFGSRRDLSENEVRPVVQTDLTELRDLCAKNGVKLLVIPRMNSAMFDRGRAHHLRGGQEEWHRFAQGENATSFMYEVLRELKMSAFDPSDGFLEASYGASMFIDAAHFTPAGHRVMAELLANKLCTDSWLPKPCRSAEPSSMR